MKRIKVRRTCPCCRAKAVEGSGGWATEYVCGTRRGNLSESLLWRGLACYVKSPVTVEDAVLRIAAINKEMENDPFLFFGRGLPLLGQS